MIAQEITAGFFNLETDKRIEVMTTLGFTPNPLIDYAANGKLMFVPFLKYVDKNNKQTDLQAAIVARQ